MKTDLQVVPPHPYEAYRLVIHHDQREDFTVYKPAGFVLRWYALTLDLTLATPLDVLIHMPFTRYLERLHAFGHTGIYLALTVFLTLVPLGLYAAVPTWLWGQTLGKRIVGLRVLKASCNPALSFEAVLLRETVGKFLSLAVFGLGFVLAATGARKRALHDHLAGTVVISYRDR